MGGLAGKMKATNLTFLVSGLALAAAFPFAGFFSKDEILAGVAKVGTPLYTFVAFAALGIAFITALYTGRQYGQIFGGAPRDQHLHDHAHESPAVMTIPLWILAAGAVVAGFLGFPHIPGVPAQLHAFSNWLEPVFHGAGSAHGVVDGTAAAHGHGPDTSTWILLGAGLVIGWLGWFIGRGMGVKEGAKTVLPESTGKFSLDAIYNATFVRAGMALSLFSRWFDEIVINGVGSFVGSVSGGLRLTQTSFVRNYALGMAVGAAVIIALFAIGK
jgi:NADH-quinone oxidoreductase subunit L